MSSSLVFTQKRKVTSAFMDSSAKMGISQSVLMVQDNLTECFGMLNADNYVYKEKFNSFWVFTKNKLHFTRRPSWREEFTAQTFPVNNKGFRTDVNSVFIDNDGQNILTSNIECCCLDFDKHRPVKLSNNGFPTEDFPTPVLTDSFEKFEVEYDENDFVYEQVIHSQMLDMSHHMNNTEYVKLAVNVFSDEFINSHEPKDLEVHYIGESKENQCLRIYCKEVDDNFYVRITENQRTVFEMKISFY